jgi:hypothetical protein
MCLCEYENIRFGVSTDGLNPFGNQSSTYSTWPWLGLSHGNATTPQPPASAFGVQSPDHEEPAAQQDDLVQDDDDNDYYDQFIALPRDNGGFMDPIDEPPYHDPDACEPTTPTEKGGCMKKRLFGSQEMSPVEAFT